MPASGEPSVARRLEALGLALPEPPLPLGQYVAAAEAGGLLFVSGMLPLEQGRPTIQGRLGGEVAVTAGRGAARRAALQALAVADRALGGLHRVRRPVRIAVSMTADPEFRDHAAVADGASELFAELFDGGHARLAFGVHTLPLGASVLLDVIFELAPEP